MKQLYSQITVIPNSKLDTKSKRIKNYQDCHGSVLCGLRGCYDEKRNLAMVLAKLKLLNQALGVNPELSTYTGQLKVFGYYSQEIIEQLVILINQTVKTNPTTKIFIEHKKLRKYLKLHCGQMCSVIIDSEEEYGILSRIDEVDIRVSTFAHVPRFDTVKSVIIRDPKLYIYLKSHQIILKPEAINIDKHTDLSVIDFSRLRNLEVTISDQHDDILTTLEPLVNLTKLRKLAIVQSNLYKHETNELIDIKVLKFLNFHDEEFTNLSYLMISYNPPHNGIIDDGVEGNYLRKLSILTILTKILNNFRLNKINVILPNFLMVLSCYEQAMNNMMWNGCKCSYCEVYLNKLDEFINYHKYFDGKEDYWKDLNNSIVLNTLSHYYQDRYLIKNNWDYMASGTLQIKNWNFHNNYCSPIQFQCSVLQNVFQSDYNEKDQEVFFDSYQQFHECEYFDLFPAIAKCLTHYLQDINHQLINLNRGDAESFQLALNTLNDGSETVNITNLSLNGFQFNFDKETNGTNFVESYFD